MRLGSSCGLRLARALALCCTGLLLLVVFQASAHYHASGQDEIACQFCQLNHPAGIPSTGTPTLVSPLLPNGLVQVLVLKLRHEIFYEGSSSRAPPACFAA
jgi:hypothetical protein